MSADNSSQNENKSEKGYLEGDLETIVDRLIDCTEMTSKFVLSLLPIPLEREIELSIFSQWVTKNSAILNGVDPTFMDVFYSEQNWAYITPRHLPDDYHDKLSLIKVKRFKEYDEFLPVIQSLFKVSYYDGTLSMKFMRVVFTNLLGDEAYNYLPSKGLILLVNLVPLTFRHGMILGGKKADDDYWDKFFPYIIKS